jgi:hypothetical protein
MDQIPLRAYLLGGLFVLLLVSVARKLVKQYRETGSIIDPNAPTLAEQREARLAARRPAPTPTPTAAVAGPVEDPDAFIESIPRLAEMHRDLTRQRVSHPVEYDEAAFAQTDAFISEGWPDGKLLMPDQTIAVIGSYVGESVRRTLGGTWGYTEARGFHLDGVGGGAQIYPFAKVAKRFENGMDDSLATYYAALKQIILQEQAKRN